MKYTFQKLFLLLFVVSGLVVSLAPSPAEAALVPCGRSSGTAAEQAPCTICHVVIGAQGLIQWGLNIMTIIAITVTFAMAVLYVISAGDEGMMGTAKGGIKAALIGFAVMLSAWLIVNVVLTVLSVNSSGPLGGLVQNGTFKFSCDPNSTVRTQ